MIYQTELTQFQSLPVANTPVTKRCHARRLVIVDLLRTLPCFKLEDLRGIKKRRWRLPTPSWPPRDVLRFTSIVIATPASTFIWLGFTIYDHVCTARACVHGAFKAASLVWTEQCLQYFASNMLLSELGRRDVYFWEGGQKLRASHIRYGPLAGESESRWCSL